MFEKCLAPVDDEMRQKRFPFLKFISELVDEHAKDDEENIEMLEAFAWSILCGIDGFYIDSDAEVDLISRSNGKQISCDLHAAFYWHRVKERWHRKIEPKVTADFKKRNSEIVA